MGAPGSRPNPEVVAEVARLASERLAYHEAGHAVAAVARGGRVLQVSLGFADWDDDTCERDRPGFVEHVSVRENTPFVTFAGPWATARWLFENPDGDSFPDDMDDALDLAWDLVGDGDREKYNAFVDELEARAAELGFPTVGCAWETQWHDELDDLYRSIEVVAKHLIEHETVDHGFIAKAVAECRDQLEQDKT